MDECLAQLAELQHNDRQQELQDELHRLETMHSDKLNQILGNGLYHYVFIHLTFY